VLPGLRLRRRRPKPSPGLAVPPDSLDPDHRAAAAGRPRLTTTTKATSSLIG
jgi:hypothetical protein